MSAPSQDGAERGWLSYDQDHPEPHDVDAAARDQQVETTDTAWLRHDLPDGDATAVATNGVTQDSAWLAPEVQVVADHPTESESHDTGVPPTLAQPPAEATGPTESTGPAEATEPTEATGPTKSTEPTESAAARSRTRRTGSSKTRPSGGLAVMGAAVKEFAIVVGMALVLSFVVKTWLLQAFYIPSGSMEDTLVLNDRVIVSKLTPGPMELKRGDIVVFADPGEWLDPPAEEDRGVVVTLVRDTMAFVGLLPDNSENHLIKRVIGLPGDHIVCCDAGGRVAINDAAIKEPYLKPGDAASEQDFDITVPRGRVWVMGDHRSNSADSRAHDGPENNGTQGSVDQRLIVGRAVSLVWPLDHLTWLSNPTSTFAQVPDPGPADQPSGDPGGVDGGGGGEIPGQDGEAPTGGG